MLYHWVHFTYAKQVLLILSKYYLFISTNPYTEYVSAEMWDSQLLHSVISYYVERCLLYHGRILTLRFTLFSRNNIIGGKTIKQLLHIMYEHGKVPLATLQCFVIFSCLAVVMMSQFMSVNFVIELLLIGGVMTIAYSTVNSSLPLAN